MIKEKAALGGAIIAAFVSSLCCIAPLLFVLLGVGSFGAATMFEPLRPYLMGGAVLLLAVAYYWVYFKREAKACAPGEACASKPVSRAGRFGLWFAILAVILFALTPYIAAPLAARLSAKKTDPPMSQTDDCCIAQRLVTANANETNADVAPNTEKIDSSNADIKNESCIVQKPKTTKANTQDVTQNATPETEDCCVSKMPTRKSMSQQNATLSGNLARATFTVTGMTCASCEITIKLALEKTQGIKSAEVSYDRSEAIVIYDTKVTTPEKLRDAINQTGYRVKE